MSLAETTELAVKASRRPGWKPSTASVCKRRPKGRQVGAVDKEDIFVVNLEDEVETLAIVGEETFGF